MARKFHEENERIKRHYLQFMREAKRSDMATVDKAAEAILRFERSTGFKPLKRFHIDQAITFKRHLSTEKSARTGVPLSKATVDGTLRAVKAFVLWLAGQPGYKSRIAYADAEYFNLNAKDVRVAHAARDTPYPTPEQCRHAFAQMPDVTPLQRRDKALFAFLMLSGARDGAVASMRLKHVDLVQGCVYQDARDVKTKFAKTFTTWFFPVDDAYLRTFRDWVSYLRQDELFGAGDALFPKPQMGLKDGAFACLGLSRENCAP
jgi:integrase